jgi:hypothetical protein
MIVIAKYEPPATRLWGVVKRVVDCPSMTWGTYLAVCGGIVCTSLYIKKLCHLLLHVSLGSMCSVELHDPVILSDPENARLASKQDPCPLPPGLVASVQS